MIHSRLVLLPVFYFTFAVCYPASAQSVVSTHSGVVYFFDGDVYMGDQQLAQRFGRFPEIAEGGELRTGRGRAEVLLTPGVFLRIADNSSIRLVSNQLSDTKVELTGGSAIVETSEGSSAPPVQVTYEHWRLRVPREGVYRIDSKPPSVSVYKGEVDITDGDAAKPFAAREGETVPLASVLAPDPAAIPANDAFKSWAMSRSQAVASDNATAAGIMDDPDAIDNAAGSLAGFSYFPLTGIPGIGLTNPYGLSFWSPYQSALSAAYLPAYSYSYLYPVGWPSNFGYRYPLGLGRPLGSTGLWPIGSGTHLGGSVPIRIPYAPPGRTTVPGYHPHPVAPPPHVVVRPGVVRR